MTPKRPETEPPQWTPLAEKVMQFGRLSWRCVVEAQTCQLFTCRAHLVMDCLQPGRTGTESFSRISTCLTPTTSTVAWYDVSRSLSRTQQANGAQLTQSCPCVWLCPLIHRLHWHMTLFMLPRPMERSLSQSVICRHLSRPFLRHVREALRAATSSCATRSSSSLLPTRRSRLVPSLRIREISLRLFGCMVATNATIRQQ